MISKTLSYALLAAAMSGTFASAQVLDVKPGSWETVTTSVVNGETTVESVLECAADGEADVSMEIVMSQFADPTRTCSNYLSSHTEDSISFMFRCNEPGLQMTGYSYGAIADGYSMLSMQVLYDREVDGAVIAADITAESTYKGDC